MPINNGYGAFCIGQQYYVAMHLTDTDEWDYTIYDICFHHLDGGQIGEEMDYSLHNALTEICKLHDLLGDEMTVNEVDDEILETLVERIEESAVSIHQVIYISNLLIDGEDPIRFKIREKTIDLTDGYLSFDQVNEIKYKAMVEKIDRSLFSKDQWYQIQRGIDAGLDVGLYADSAFNPEQMKALRIGLELESRGYIFREQLYQIADKELEAAEMKDWILYEEKRNGKGAATITSQRKEILEKNAATEELAYKLDNFGYDYDLYSYRDAYDTRMDGFEQMLGCIQDEQFEEIEEYLLDVLENDSTDELVQRVENLLNDISIFKEKYVIKDAAEDEYAASL